MFYSITGIPVVTGTNFVVLETGGVGYRLTVSGHTLGFVCSQRERSKESPIRLLTWLSVREDALELFGFAQEQELFSFQMLLTVSGVGPKVAIAILSLLSPEQFALAVTTGDSRMLARASGVGKRIADRIVLELKDKGAKTIGLGQTAEDLQSPRSADSPLSGGILEDAVSTLLVLGYSRAQADAALRGMDPSASLEDVIRDALKKLSRNV